MLGDRETAGLSPRTFPSPDLCRAHGHHRCTFVKTMDMLNNYLLVASWGEACAALDSRRELPTRWVTLFSKTALTSPTPHGLLPSSPFSASLAMIVAWWR